MDQNIAYVGPSLRHPSFEILDEYISATKRPPKGSIALVFLQRCDTEQVQYKGIVHTYYKYVDGKDLNGKIKPENNYVKLYNSAILWDTTTKVGSKYSLRRPLSETPVIWNFGRIFRLQNGRRREVALVFLQRCDTEQVQYKGIVYTRIINMWLGKDLNGKNKAWK